MAMTVEAATTPTIRIIIIIIIVIHNDHHPNEVCNNDLVS